jgi:hypothetical protein
MEIRTAEPLVSDPISFDVEIDIKNLKKYKSPCIDQILVELTQAQRETIYSEIHKLINPVWNKEELPSNERSLLL